MKRRTELYGDFKHSYYAIAAIRWLLRNKFDHMIPFCSIRYWIPTIILTHKSVIRFPKEVIASINPFPNVKINVCLEYFKYTHMKFCVLVTEFTRVYLFSDMFIFTVLLFSPFLFSDWYPTFIQCFFLHNRNQSIG